MSCIGDSKPVFHVKFPAVPSRSPSETARFGEALARHAYSGLLVLLMGDLGSGKTLLAKSVGSFLGAADMRSPTFMIELVHKLPGKNFSIAHFDLYRLGPDGGDDVGLQLYEGSDVLMQIEERVDDGNLVLVEWGEHWVSPPLSERWDIRILSCAGDERAIELSASGEKALSALAEAYADILGVLDTSDLLKTPVSLSGDGPC